jgi:hypothetical protein
VILKIFIVLFGLFIGFAGMVPSYTSRWGMIRNFLVVEAMWYFVVFSVLIWGIK